MADHPILDRDRQRLPEPMTEEDFEDFLTAVIGLSAERTKAGITKLQAFAEGVDHAKPLTARVNQ